jgi:hypothetical protein
MLRGNSPYLLLLPVFDIRLADLGWILRVPRHGCESTFLGALNTPDISLVDWFNDCVRAISLSRHVASVRNSESTPTFVSDSRKLSLGLC